MTLRNQLRAHRARTPAKRPDVGYGRPPVEHRFKPGQSGNPRGLPKGSKNEATIIAELLGRRFEVRQEGKVRTISLLEAILVRFAEDALLGNSKSATFLLNRKMLAESSEPPAIAVPDSNDKKVLEFYARELEEQFKRGDGK